MEEFSLQKLVDMFSEGIVDTFGMRGDELTVARYNNLNTSKDNIVKCKEYIDKYFFPCDNGMHYLYKKGNFEPYAAETIKKTYVDKFPKELGKWYFKENLKLYKFISDVNKPRINGDEINLSGSFMHEKKDYKSFSEETKSACELFLSFIKEVIANDNEEHYLYVLKWISNMCKGNRNDSMIYLKGVNQH